MPSKKKKYNARFPAGRIKKIMQSDEEVGKVAQAVPIIISRTLELFVESLLTKTLKITNSRNAKTLSTSHMKQCIMSEQRFDFLRELVRNIPDISVAEEAANYQEEDNQSSPEEQYPDSDTPYDLSMPSTSLRAGRQQQLQHTASNGHNGGGHHVAQMHAAPPAHEYQRNYLKRSMSSNPSSVIRHTTAMAQTNVDCLPAKLARSDSTPVPQHQQQLPTSASSPTTTTMQHQQQQHPRLKHQSYSMPTHMENSNNNNNNNNKPNTQTPLKSLRTPSQQTAIPAPIVNIDYCSKPVVKIDYSNLPLAGVTASANVVAAPLSAPANISSTAFNFPAEPVINIDLSNIVASATSAVPSVATISIGAPIIPQPQKLPSSSSLSSCTSPSTLTSSSASTSSLINKNKPSSAKTAVVEQQSRNSKAAMAEPFNSSTSSSTSTTTKATALAVASAVAAATTMTTTISTSKKSDSYLDMDEDYDNI